MHVFRKLGMKHEACFAGKLNGKSCRMQMQMRETDVCHELLDPEALNTHDAIQSNVTLGVVKMADKCRRCLTTCL